MPANPLQANDSVDYEFCNGQFCRLLSTFEVPSAESELRRSFTDLLIGHGAQNIYGKGGIPIGTKDEVLSRSRDRCPFCVFVRRAAQFAPKLLTHSGRSGDDLFVVQVSAQQEDEYLWLRVLPGDSPDGEAIGSLMLPGEQIVLVARSEDGGSRTGRVVGDKPDYDRMRKWLHLCDTGPAHRGVCTQFEDARTAERRSELLPRLRVVDVQDMRLVDIAWGERYVALSYVWGGASPPKLLKSQVEAFAVPGALEELVVAAPSTPATIRDLFSFTRNMGLRYLWFDSLCLIQDDPGDLLRGIANMELVYESSYVTLIAADTESANTGIPGVGVLARSVRQDVQRLKPGLDIMRVHSVDRHLRRSRWNTRGWTLQEYYLSRRTITFVNNQAYFRCRQRTWYEELWTDLEPGRPRGQDLDVLTFARDNMDLGTRDVATYSFLFQVLEIYRGRDLTDENDALRAMAGILGRVAARANTDIVQGMPARIFPLALLFLHTGERAPTRRERFPSWSWAGWKGRDVSWYPFDRMDLMNSADEDNDFNEDKELEKALEKFWISFGAVGPLEESENESCADGHFDEPETIWKPTRPVSVRKHPDDGTVDAEEDGLDWVRALPGVADSELDHHRHRHNHHHRQQQQQLAARPAALSVASDGVSLPVREYPLLVFDTATAHFRLKTIPEGGDEDDDGHCPDDAERPTFAEYGSRTYEVGGRDDEDCGVLYADEKLSLEDDNVERFAVLGECHKVEFPLEFDAYCEGEGAEEPVLWVMLIRFVDGAWQRRGVGQILQSSLAKSLDPGVAWEKIVLG
ncbi:hypothetical protein PV08_00818 [Exophiala spinifera]|uniref:Heterokaryon incompatibility domain-containing protein n=1 Tax=Exophiala spinifera TaxID=91928 RepID=A0A0D2BMS1_9EURO|nr:uncharacterized protein PV08_00818 [Exophiala spinifera]KIW20243.1 hypothetical protein PV08_00818 [Exophiala spinifera]